MEHVRAPVARRSAWRFALWLWLVAASPGWGRGGGAGGGAGALGAHGLCPPRCSCDDSTKSAACVAAALEVVPIQLNPEATHINLTRNNIHSVQLTLAFYTKLTTLDISHNNINTLGNRNFDSNFDLVFLNASNNSILSIEKNAFIGLKSLIILDLDNNRISNVHPLAFKDLHQLQEMRLSNNRLVSFEVELFKPLVNLKTLTLDNNQLLEIPTDNLVFTVNMEYLTLSGNIIQTVRESSASNLRRLKRLELADNIISEVHHSGLDGLISLQYLNMDRNNLTVIPTAALSKLSNLTHLSLSENFFESIPPVSFQSLFNLRHLHLSRLEKVSKIDSRAFVDNINLERIWMNDNLRISTIPTKTFHGNPKLTHISIKSNALFTLQASHFPLDQLQSLQLAGNPLHCNCSLLWLWKLGQEHSKHATPVGNASDYSSIFIDFSDIRCTTPEHLENALLANVPESEIRCSINWITIMTAVLLLGVTVSIVVSILYYVGGMKRCSKDKSKHVMADSDLTSNLPKMSNGIMYGANHQKPSDDKVEINRYLMMAPQMQDTYHSTPPWHTMNKAPMNGELCENMYQQFGYESIPHRKTMDRPHIVYV
ncbi:fish-lips [Arctopsyche grandis]|uniref:fish-lips n=1 Tax=Arctopsyche grandis TaxID=121162 RepID=UPI00406D7A5F